MLYLIVLFTLFIPTYSSAEKLYVIERERGSLSVIEDKRWTKSIEGLGDTNHAIVKFYRGSGYVITRDGYISKLDLTSNRLIKKVRVGKSSIGLEFCDGFIAVANYDPKDVVILDLDLHILKRIETGSRNVGIKAKERFLVFSLMDKDEIWVLDSTKGFEPLKVFRDVGSMPFDALMAGKTYIVGFYKEGALGILDIERLEYKKKVVKKGEEIPFKIPHFGRWGILGDRAFIPAVGERRVYVIDLKRLDYHSHIDLIGLPVFVVTSPDGKYLAVNYSGEKEDFITIIDGVNQSVLKDIKIGRRVMHIRPSMDGRWLYLSSYFDGKVKVLRTEQWDIEVEVDIPTPSGIFIVPEEKENED